MPWSTCSRRVVPGAICLSASARGKRSTIASRGGPNAATGSASSARCGCALTEAARSWMRLSRAHTKTHAVQKGARTPCFGPLSRWFFNQDSRARRCARSAALHHADARSTARLDRRRGIDIACPRQGLHRGHRLRLGANRRGDSRAAHARGNPVPAHAQEAEALQSPAVCDPLPHRVECFFHRLKRCRRIATRYEKTARNYLALVHFACALMWLAP